MKMLVLILALLPQQQQPKPPTPEEMQKAMAMLGPGPEHKDFEPLAGTWDMKAIYSMGTGQSMTVTGRADNTLILGGRFLRSESRGTAPAMNLTIEAMTIYGFDRRTGEYTLVGYDTMGTYYVTAAGKRAPGAKEVVMKGEIDETPAGQAPMRMKYDMVLRWVDADTYVSEIIFHLPGGDLKIAEMTFTRVK